MESLDDAAWAVAWENAAADDSSSFLQPPEDSAELEPPDEDPIPKEGVELSGVLDEQQPQRQPSKTYDSLAALQAHQLQLQRFLTSWQLRQEVIVGEIVGGGAGGGVFNLASGDAVDDVVVHDHQEMKHPSATSGLEEAVAGLPPAPPAEPDAAKQAPVSLEVWNDIVERHVGQSASNLNLRYRRSASMLMAESWWQARVHQYKAIFRNLKKIVHHCAHRLQNPVPLSTTRLGRIVQSRYFELATCAVIVANSVLMAYTTDYARKHLVEPSPVVFQSIETAFCIIYCIELSLRVWVLRSHFILSREWTWNMFDAVLVLLAVYDLLPVEGLAVVQNLTFLRSVRLLKMMKVLRLVRLMKQFKELRLITQSILKSMRTMMWSVVLVGALLFLASLMFTQATTAYLQDNPDQASPDMEHYWGSLGGAMQSLYLAVSGGNDWELIAGPLKRIGGPYYPVFFVYTAFYMWVLTNTLTSVFVETTMRSAVVDTQQIIQDQLENKERYIRMLIEWYATLDKDGEGISQEDFVQKLNDPAMYAFASSMDIELSDVQEFFDVLTANGKKKVDLSTFVIGCIRLQGGAKGLDLIGLVYEHRQAIGEHKRFQEYCTHQFAKLRRDVRNCTSALKAVSTDVIIEEHESAAHEESIRSTQLAAYWARRCESAIVDESQ